MVSHCLDNTSEKSRLQDNVYSMTSRYVCIFIYTLYTHRDTYTYIYIYIYMHICFHIYIYIYEKPGRIYREMLNVIIS